MEYEPQLRLVERLQRQSEERRVADLRSELAYRRRQDLINAGVQIVTAQQNFLILSMFFAAMKEGS